MLLTIGPISMQMRVPTLQQLAIATLIKWRAALGDVGDVPVELLADLLAACSPQELMDIEDGTMAGSGRVLAPWLWPHWHRLYVAQFGQPDPAVPLPALLAAADVAPGPPGATPANYR
jgi:hypothetical protein